MTRRPIHVLHVEDDPIQQRLIAHFLTKMPDYEVRVSAVDNEEAAVGAVRAGSVDFVLLDYMLSQGNGLSCLQRIRQLDPIVPVIAISGAANAEIFSELLLHGAADCLNKGKLDWSVFVESFENALKLADVWRHRAPAPNVTAQSVAAERLRVLMQSFLESLPPEFERDLDAFQESARDLDLPCVQRLLDAQRLEATGPGAYAGSVNARLRPLMLEILLRLFGAASGALAISE